jgi:hypothetical protein
MTERNSPESWAREFRGAVARSPLVVVVGRAAGGAIDADAATRHAIASR